MAMASSNELARNTASTGPKISSVAPRAGVLATPLPDPSLDVALSRWRYRRRGHDLEADGLRPRERDQAGLGMGDQRGADLFSQTWDELQHPGRKASGGERLN